MTSADRNVIDKLASKFDSTGQDLNTHLNGLLHSKPLTYWDYIQTDALDTPETTRISAIKTPR